MLFQLRQILPLSRLAYLEIVLIVFSDILAYSLKRAESEWALHLGLLNIMFRLDQQPLTYQAQTLPSSLN